MAVSVSAAVHAVGAALVMTRTTAIHVATWPAPTVFEARLVESIPRESTASDTSKARQLPTPASKPARPHVPIHDVSAEPDDRSVAHHALPVPSASTAAPLDRPGEQPATEREQEPGGGGVSIPGSESASPNALPSDGPPRLKSAPEPPYPLEAREDAEEGLVVLRVLVTNDGRAGEIRVSTSSGYRLLDRAAVAGVRAWTFEPAVKRGSKVEAWLDVPVRFVLR